MNELELPNTLTLAQALQFDQALIDESELCLELVLTAVERKTAALTWLALLGLKDDGSADARAAWAEVVDDGPLVVALHRSPAEFLAWWRCAEWWAFTRSANPCGEEESAGHMPGIPPGQDTERWARGVLVRALAAFEAAGSMAGQVGMTAELVWRANTCPR